MRQVLGGIDRVFSNREDLNDATEIHRLEEEKMNENIFENMVDMHNNNNLRNFGKISMKKMNQANSKRY